MHYACIALAAGHATSVCNASGGSRTSTEKTHTIKLSLSHLLSVFYRSEDWFKLLSLYVSFLDIFLTKS